MFRAYNRSLLSVAIYHLLIVCNTYFIHADDNAFPIVSPIQTELFSRLLWSSFEYRFVLYYLIIKELSSVRVTEIVHIVKHRIHPIVPTHAFHLYPHP